MILAAQWYHGILAFFFAVFAVLVMLVILLQRGRGVGLAGAFGGVGGTTATFGAKTGDVLTWVTVIGAAVLLTYTVVLNFLFFPSGPGLGGPAAPETPPAGESGTPAPGAMYVVPNDAPGMPPLTIFGEVA